MEIPNRQCLSDKYVHLLQSSLNTQNHFSGRSVHAQVIKSGLHLGVFLMNTLMNYYAKTGSARDAQDVFDEMRTRNTSSWNTILSMHAKKGSLDTARKLFYEMPERDSVTWAAMIAGYNHIHKYGKAIQMFVDMIMDGVSPTEYTFTNVLSSCSAIEGLRIGKKVHSLVVKTGFGGSVTVANSLLNMYIKSGDALTADIVFSRMKLKSTSTWNLVISRYMHSGQVDLALSQFDKMDKQDIVTWNTVIAGCNQHGYNLESLTIFSKMMESYLMPDKFALASALSACASVENLRFGIQIHAYLTKSALDANPAVKNALVAMYVKCGQIENGRKVVETSGTTTSDIIAYTALLDGYLKTGDIAPARQIFDSLTDRDIVIWTAMIVGYVQNGLINEAMEVFKEMLRTGPRPNSHTFSAMLRITSSLASLGHGKQIHASAVRAGEASSVSVGNALINMYAKAGSIDLAKRMFDLICLKRDTVSWTSMIIAFGQHGLGEDAIELFEKMLLFKIKPDHITYVGVLSACTHIGLVDLGKRYYHLMQNAHNIEPTLSHYALMIDLLGRSGLLQEAHDFIKSMPIEPDSIAWGSLLASCKVYKNKELADVAAERLLKIDPCNSGAYTTLANLTSACGNFKEAAKIRKLMKERGVKKEQGSSWIEIKNVVHVFGADDGVHPQRDEIYTLMDNIWNEIKKMGFVPDMGSVLHDLEDEVKEEILRHHSEKLAIAFGLLSTSDKTTLRIMKNLRVCNDCHSAIKFISKLVGREIVVRDSTRFHHFKDGFCSCRDYW